MTDPVTDFLDNLLQNGCSGSFEATKALYRFFPWISRIEADRRVKAWEVQRKKLTAKALTTNSTPLQDASHD
jgi:hypothetical protein